MNDEQLDYQLHRLSKGKSTCFESGNWAYLDSKGGLHKLRNEGYYAPWKCDMWVSSYWSKNSWAMGKISPSKSGLILEIENNINDYPEWIEGFGKTPSLSDLVEA